MMTRLLYPLFILFLFIDPVYAKVTPGPLVDTSWLAKNKGEVLILDVRKDIRSFTAKPVYAKDKKSGKLKLVRVGGHIPGASLVDYKKVRTKRKIDGRIVTRMVPEKIQFEELMRQAGVSRGSAIVIVSKGESPGDTTVATRLYWQLKYYGHSDLSILNGGMAQWLKDGGKVTTKLEKVGKGNWSAGTEDKSIFASSNDVARALKDGKTQLVDTRALNQYLGTYYKKSYVYAPGHIPGAKTFPNELVTRPKAPATFTKVKDLRTLAKELDINTDGQIITYCNSGHLASGAWFVISELMGNNNVRLYDGSMHQWTLEKRPTVKMKME